MPKTGDSTISSLTSKIAISVGLAGLVTTGVILEKKRKNDVALFGIVDDYTYNLVNSGKVKRLK